MNDSFYMFVLGFYRFDFGKKAMEFSHAPACQQDVQISIRTPMHQLDSTELSNRFGTCRNLCIIQLFNSQKGPSAGNDSCVKTA